MTSTTRLRSQAAILFVAPAVLLAGELYHPYLEFPRESVVADAAAADPTRWGLAHLVVGVGYGLLAVAFLALRAHLRESGEEPWSARALAPVVLGCSLTAILTGMEFAPLTAAETGGDVEAAQRELLPWFLPIVAASGVAYALGALGFALALVRSGVPSSGWARLVAAALLATAIARFVPLGAAFYVTGVATVVAFWPLAYSLWERGQAEVPERRRATPAT